MKLRLLSLVVGLGLVSQLALAVDPADAYNKAVHFFQSARPLAVTALGTGGVYFGSSADWHDSGVSSYFSFSDQESASVQPVSDPVLGNYVKVSFGGDDCVLSDLRLQTLPNGELGQVTSRPNPWGSDIQDTVYLRSAHTADGKDYLVFFLSEKGPGGTVNRVLYFLIY